MSVKKLAIVVTCFSKSQPGFLDFSYRIHSLSKHYQLTIISQDTLTQSELMISDANYIALGQKSGKLGWLGYLLKSAAYIKRSQPSVVILLHSSASPISLMVGSIPTCLYWNEHPTNLMRLSDKFSPVGNYLAKMAHSLVFYGAKKSHLVMPIGEDHHADLIQHQVNPQRIKMMYMGVADSFLSENKQQIMDINKVISLICIGTVSKARGRDVMLDAIALMAKNKMDIHLTLVGASVEELNYCQQRIAELNIASHVTVLGRVPGDQVAQHLAQADMGICLWEKTPWTEFNPPTKLFEYLVAGLPVLASNIRTHTRYIHHWQNGLIFEYDASSLADSMLTLQNNKAKLAELKNNAAVSGIPHLWSNIEVCFLAEVKALIS